MPEGHLRPERDQAARLCGVSRSFRDAEPLGSPPHERRVPGRIARGDESQAPGVPRQSRHSPLEALLDPSVSRRWPRYTEAAGDL